MRVEAQETTYVWHGWHEQPWGILMFFREERDLPGQLKLIVWFMNPIGLHWLQKTAGSREPMMGKERHVPTQCFTRTISTSQPRRRNSRSTSTALQTALGRLFATSGGRVTLLRWKREKFSTSTGFETVTSRYWCDHLTNSAMKPLTMGVGHLWVLMGPWGMRRSYIWMISYIEVRGS